MFPVDHPTFHGTRLVIPAVLTDHAGPLSCDVPPAEMPDLDRSAPVPLPLGVLLIPSRNTHDQAGRLMELYREDWPLAIAPVQWNFVLSRSNTLRGVHVHVTHSDYLCVVRGQLLLALHDMRPHAPTYRLSAQMVLSGDACYGAVIPPGVAHGFYFAGQTAYFYAVSHYWNPADELGCRFDDPEHGLSWPTRDPLLSPRDAHAPSYAELVRALDAAVSQHAIHS